MSKKKSYMDVDNILSEGIYDKFVDKIANMIAKSNLKKDKKIKKDLNNLNKDIKDLWDDFNKRAKEIDPNYKTYKPKTNYKLSDFLD